MRQRGIGQRCWSADRVYEDRVATKQNWVGLEVAKSIRNAWEKVVITFKGWHWFATTQRNGEAGGGTGRHVGDGGRWRAMGSGEERQERTRMMWINRKLYNKIGTNRKRWKAVLSIGEQWWAECVEKAFVIHWVIAYCSPRMLLSDYVKQLTLLFFSRSVRSTGLRTYLQQSTIHRSMVKLSKTAALSSPGSATMMNAVGNQVERWATIRIERQKERLKYQLRNKSQW